MKWHVPSLEEKLFAKELLETFLLPVLDRLTQFTQGNEMTRYYVFARYSGFVLARFPPGDIFCANKQKANVIGW